MKSHAHPPDGVGGIEVGVTSPEDAKAILEQHLPLFDEEEDDGEFICEYSNRDIAAYTLIAIDGIVQGMEIEFHY